MTQISLPSSSLPLGSKRDLSGLPLVTRDYQLVEQISSDDLGIVWRAKLRSSGQEVTLRVLTVDLYGDNRYGWRLERFKLQATVYMGLNHPNTAALLAFGEVNAGGESAVFVATDLLPGTRLNELLLAEEPMDHRRALLIAIGICRSLEDAHTRGVVHGDLRPAHVEVGEDGVAVRVGGYCECAVFDGEYASSEPVGTSPGWASYRAPEAIRRGDLDGRADLYSLGAILFQMLTGRALFARDSVSETLMAHMLEPAPTLSGRAERDFPLALESLVRRCLAKTARERYPNAAALREALEAALVAGSS